MVSALLFTADILAVFMHRISDELENNKKKNISKLITQGISNAFNTVWHKGFQHKLASNGISGQILSIMKSFFSIRSLKAVTNGYSFEEHGIYACIPQESLLGTTPFPIYMNNLPRSILRSLVNIRADVWFMRSWQLIFPSTNLSQFNDGDRQAGSIQCLKSKASSISSPPC